MYIANFLTGPGTKKLHVNVTLNFCEYLHSKINTKGFLENLSATHRIDFVESYYYGGTSYVNK